MAPVLLATGGIEKGLYDRLSGLDYDLQKKLLAPHSRLVDWLVESSDTF